MTYLNNHSVEVKVTGVNSIGQGISRLTDGKVLFINGALPGEKVEAIVEKEKKQYALGKLVKILEKHPKRVVPHCPLYGKCGGCQLQHCSYDLQLEIKRNILVDALERIGRLNISSKVDKCVPSPVKWNYRNKASFPARKKGHTVERGFYQMGSHHLIPVELCPVLEDSLNDVAKVVFSKLKNLKIPGYDEKTHSGLLKHIILRKGSFTGDIVVCIVLKELPGRKWSRILEKAAKDIASLFPSVKGLNVNVNPDKTNRIIGNSSLCLYGDDFITEKLKDKLLEYESTSFFQVNSYQAIHLFSFTAEQISKDGQEKVLELYSGAGALTVFLSEKAKKVCSVESWESSAKSMKKNLERNEIKNVSINTGKAEKLLQSLKKEEFSSVVLDPPRVGCHRNVIDYISESGIPEVVYVSCNPATLARDCAILAENGYRFSRIKPFDMFPQTCHVETVILMSKKGD